MSVYCREVNAATSLTPAGGAYVYHEESRHQQHPAAAAAAHRATRVSNTSTTLHGTTSQTYIYILYMLILFICFCTSPPDPPHSSRPLFLSRCSPSFSALFPSRRPRTGFNCNPASSFLRRSSPTTHSSSSVVRVCFLCVGVHVVTGASDEERGKQGPEWGQLHDTGIMASAAPGGARGRRKQAKPQRKVELDESGAQYNTVLSEIATTMSPDPNHNELLHHHHHHLPPDGQQMMMMNGHKMGDVPEEVDDRCRQTTSRSALSEEEEIEEYLSRSDTAIIYSEAVERTSGEDVPALTNGVSKEGEEGECFIKCPQCQKGCQTLQSLKDHMELLHPEACIEARNLQTTPSAVSPTPSLGGGASGIGPYGCSQCATSFASKDQLEKHELLHSANAQVSCKICNKTFANVYRLQRHMISHDESAVLRKFKCTECDKAFKFKHHLKEHIRIHSGEKPFACGNCGKRFSHSGSYSSHMTSKKCLVMNLKLGRTRAPTTTASSGASEKMQSQSGRGPKRQLNNNIATTNHNAYLPILPKYTDAAAAFIQNMQASNPAIHPFYVAQQSFLNAANGHPINPYTMPALTHLLEQLQGSSPSHRMQEDVIKLEDQKESNKSTSSSCGDLIMDEEEEVETKSENNDSKSDLNSNQDDLEAVKRILDTVNASVTSQLLRANMQKYSDNSSDCQSVRSAHSPPTTELYCNGCKKNFAGQLELEEHECEADVKSEGLAAKLEEAIVPKTEPQEATGSGNEEEDDKQYDMDSESVTTTDQLTEDGRKVRVRSLISDEQLKVLKDNYNQNPRPKREELAKIAEKIGFQVRVVQVWFQNTRARDRREGRFSTVSYNTPPPAPQQQQQQQQQSTMMASARYPQSVVPSQIQQYPVHKIYPQHYSSEQPLDLSTKKEPSRESSPASSPHRPSSIHHHSDSGEEVVNLSHKSSRSPTPFQQQLHHHHHHHHQHQHIPAYQSHYQASNCSSEPRRSPSPVDYNNHHQNNNSRLAHILGQPSHKLALAPFMPIMQYGPHDVSNFSHLISNRISSISPNSDKRSWSDAAAAASSIGDMDCDEDLQQSKRGKPAAKGLGSPMLGNQEVEIEGQFTCDQCEKAFSKQSSLARHKYEHSGQRPHKCDECPKAFKHKHHLTEHKRLHTGEKPFQCCKCLKKFSHSGSYSQHMNHRYSYCKPYRE